MYYFIVGLKLANLAVLPISTQDKQNTKEHILIGWRDRPRSKPRLEPKNLAKRQKKSAKIVSGTN